MGSISEYFTNFQGVVWLQPDGPNTTCEPLLCADSTALDEPQGDVVIKMCREADGSWKTVNADKGTPGIVTLDIVAWKAKQRSYLQKQVERDCPVPVYFHWSFCGRHDTYLNYDSGKLVQNAWITNKSTANLAMGRAETGATPEKVEETFSLSAGPPSPEYYKLVGTLGVVDNNTAAETEPLRDIAFCTVPQCRGPCGAMKDRCDDGHIVADAGAGKALGWQTGNNAGTWTIWGASPFAVTEDISSVVCYEVDQDTTRVLVACGTAAAAGLRVAYSDDNGATWTTVVVDASASDYFTHSGSLFALDHRHIWGCTFEADVYFSSDGGLTWTDQGAPAPGATEQLNYIYFADENYGWSVGGKPPAGPTGLFIQTTDGGEHWAVATAEPAAVDGVWVSVLDAYHVWVGLSDGTIYYSSDWGATWTARTMPVTPTKTGDGMFIDDYAGYICGYRTISTVPYPIVYRTFNGGMDWEYYQYATALSTTEYYGLNAIWVCDYNEAHTVGEWLVGGSSMVWTLKPAGY